MNLVSVVNGYIFFCCLWISDDLYSLLRLLHEFYKFKNWDVVVTIFVITGFWTICLKPCFPEALCYCFFLDLIERTLNKVNSISDCHTLGDIVCRHRSVILSKNRSGEAPGIINIHVLNEHLFKWCGVLLKEVYFYMTKR